MLIVSIIFCLLIASIGCYLLFRVSKWIFNKRVRVIRAFILLVCTASVLTINKLFFVKMEVIQSKIYPNVYLIKNLDEDSSKVRQAIKEISLQQMNNLFITDDETSNKIQFYEYTTGDWGENGTAYFLEHKERADGMTAELLAYYPNYLRAIFNISYCKEISTCNYGTLTYYEDRQIIKVDTIKNKN